ncbi:MAG: leucine-rich repeat domain-containing protein [Dysgonamonadaceae bacterium]|nr:leucine-rich repeat domain-containing protein [Dysgonamonadaceae bacterium]
MVLRLQKQDNNFLFFQIFKNMTRSLIFKKHRSTINRLTTKGIAQSLIILAVCLPGFSQVQAQETSGNCGAKGADVTWNLDLPKGVLTVSGTGAIMDYVSTPPPWKPYQTSITRVVIEDGVTGIGTSVFAGCGNLTFVIIPQSLEIEMIKGIGHNAFAYCKQLTSVINLSPTPQFLSKNVNQFDSVPLENAVLYVPPDPKQSTRKPLDG